MYSTYNEEKSVVAERFIRTLKNNIFKHMTAVSKNVHRAMKMKPIDVTSDSFAEYNEMKKNSNFKVGGCVRISKYKKFFAKAYSQNWSEEVFVVSKIRNTVPWTYVISDLNGGPIDRTFYEQEFQKRNQKEFRIEKATKRKGEKLYVKWK